MPVMTAGTHELLERARTWIAEGRTPGGDSPMVLATVDEAGYPHARWLLLKEADDRGFVFYTNTRSAKGQELRRSPKATLAFYWPATGRQLRVIGDVEPLDHTAADAYWKTRPRESQLAAIASNQSATLDSREALLSRHAALTREWAGKEIPRPAHWSGYRVVPREIEFWTNGEHRLHHRERFTRDGADKDTWRGRLLNP